MTNSSHAIDHFLRIYVALHVLHCVLQEIMPQHNNTTQHNTTQHNQHNTAGSVVLEGAAAFCRVETGRRRAVRLAWIGEALADRIVSCRIAIFCLISYRIYRFLLKLYRAITSVW